MVRRPAFSFSLILLLGCFFFDSRPAGAWTPEGHQVMCAITERLLDGDTKDEAERLLAIFSHAATDLPGACAWLDWIRSRGVGHFDRWHYVNQPINPEGLPVPAPHADDVVFAIRQSINTLRDPAATDFGRAFALRVLIHVVGDIHQPLHTVSRYTAKHPNGDRGGNDFPVVTVAEGTRDDTLHIFWDRGVGLLDALPRRPPVANRPTEAAPKGVRKLADDLMRSVPRDDIADRLGAGSLGVGSLDGETFTADPESWAREGLELAETYVYRDLEEGDEPSTEYIQRAEPVVRRQLVLGAHRLAALLESLLTPPSP